LNRYQSDYYAQKAKKENFPARSVYKLKEIQQKYRLIQKGDRVLDLGCAPGSWLLYVAQLTGDQGRVVGIDKKALKARLPGHVRVIAGDVIELAGQQKENMAEIIGNGYNVVLSDMAPATTGRKDVDSAKSFHLCNAALAISENFLGSGGHFVCKIFQGEDFKGFTDAVRAGFDRTKIFKPKSCRKESKEIYIIGMGKK
jgi:23S rRNA (uridine2552-2'-O)-methyltransferase